MNVLGYVAPYPKADLTPIALRIRTRALTMGLSRFYCGVCHSDLHHVHDDWNNPTFPVVSVVPEHEIIGDMVYWTKCQPLKTWGHDHFDVGCMVDSCQQCAACKLGMGQYGWIPHINLNGI